MSIEGQGHFFTIYFPGFVCFVLYYAKISGERLQDHWSSGFIIHRLNDEYITVGFAVPGSLLLQKKANSDTFSVEAETSSFNSLGTSVETCVILMWLFVYNVVLEQGRVGLMVKSA